MKTIRAYKAQGIRDEPVDSVTLVLDETLPDADYRGPDALDQAARLYAEQARLIADALRVLPGGTYDALVGLLFADRATLFRVPHAFLASSTERAGGDDT